MLDTIYDKCMEGIPIVSDSVYKLANDYLDKYGNSQLACKAMLKNQIIKCATSGFITGFGGFITMPVTIPANVSSVIYVQMRMIACTAYLAGFALNEFIKKVGIQAGMKFTTGLIKKIPGNVLKKINQKVGYRFITKFGTTGTINLGKLVSVVGAVFGGGFDLAETTIIANRAYKWFFKNDFTVKNDKKWKR